MDNTIFRQTAWQKEDNETYYLLKHSHTKKFCYKNGYEYDECEENDSFFREQVKTPNEWKVCVTTFYIR